MPDRNDRFAFLVHFPIFPIISPLYSTFQSKTNSYVISIPTSSVDNGQCKTDRAPFASF